MAAMKGSLARYKWIALALPLLAAVMIAAALSCDNGVSDDELNAVQEELQAERALAQSLKSELDTEQAKVTRLSEDLGIEQAKVTRLNEDLEIEQAEVTRLSEDIGQAEQSAAGLESELALERATVAANKAKIDGAEAQTALLAAFLAWNRKDRDGFTANFTEQVFSGTVFSVPENLGEPAIALRRIMDTTISGDTVTIHAMFALGTQRNSALYSMAKDGSAWKIEAEDRLSPKIKGQPTVVELRLEGCVSSSESETVVEGSVAFAVENVGEGQQHLILKKVPEGLDPQHLLLTDTAADEGATSVAFIAETMAGETMNVAFSETLEPGRYALLCYPQGSKNAEGGQLPAEGIVASITVK